MVRLDGLSRDQGDLSADPCGSYLLKQREGPHVQQNESLPPCPGGDVRCKDGRPTSSAAGEVATNCSGVIGKN